MSSPVQSTRKPPPRAAESPPRAARPASRARAKPEPKRPESRAAARAPSQELLKRKPVNEPPTRVSAPAAVGAASLSFVVHITQHSNLVSSATFSLNMAQEGMFLYLCDVEVPRFSVELGLCGESLPDTDFATVFAGFCITVFAVNKVTSKSSMVFKSHQSHVSRPPVHYGEDISYFSHSCWLSGNGANVVGGVRVFFKPERREVANPALDSEYDVAIYRFSLKFWYPDATAERFESKDLETLLSMLGVL